MPPPFTGQIVVPVNENQQAIGQAATYSATISALAMAQPATDVFVLTGSATKLTRVKHVRVSGTATAATSVQLQLIKRLTADTAGTSTVPVAVAHDQNDPAATCTVAAYTVNPTINDATARPVGAVRVVLPTPATPAVPIIQAEWNFETRGEKGHVLHGVAQQLAVSFANQTVAGATLDIEMTWTEELPGP